MPWRLWQFGGDCSLHICALSFLPSGPRYLGCVALVCRVPWLLWKRKIFCITCNSLFHSILTKIASFFSISQGWSPCPASWVALQRDQRGENVTVYYFAPSFLLPLCWRRILCARWVSKTHTVQALVHTWLLHSLVTLFCALPLTLTLPGAKWFQGPLLEADQWSLSWLKSSTSYHKPCLTEYLVFKHIDLDAGPWNFKNMEKDVEAQSYIFSAARVN